MYIYKAVFYMHLLYKNYHHPRKYIIYIKTKKKTKIKLNEFFSLYIFNWKKMLEIFSSTSIFFMYLLYIDYYRKNLLYIMFFL